MDYERPTTATCRHCGRSFGVNPIGRVPLYCKPGCRVTAFDKNKRGPKVSAESRQRLLIWDVLQDAGLIPADKPLPPRRKPEDAA